jgi:hypothetical protein
MITEVTIQEKRARLPILRDALLSDADNPKGIRFDLDFWLGYYNDEMKTTKYSNLSPDDVLKLEKPEMSCGFAACAMGLATMIPEFQAAGLRLVPCETWLRGTTMMLSYGERTGYQAAGDFFGISTDEAMELFSPQYYNERTGAVGERAVARRIDALLIAPV